MGELIQDLRHVLVLFPLFFGVQPLREYSPNIGEVLCVPVTKNPRGATGEGRTGHCLTTQMNNVGIVVFLFLCFKIYGRRRPCTGTTTIRAPGFRTLREAGRVVNYNTINRGLARQT